MNEEKKCIHILAIKETETNAYYTVDSETCEEHIDDLRKTTMFGSMKFHLEWFNFCPRCGMKLNTPNEKDQGLDAPKGD